MTRVISVSAFLFLCVAACEPAPAEIGQMDYLGEIDADETVVTVVEPSLLALSLFPCGDTWCGELGFDGEVKVVGETIEGPQSMEVEDLTVTEKKVSYKAKVETEVMELTVKVKGEFVEGDLVVDVAIVFGAPLQIGTVVMMPVEPLDLDLEELDTGG